LRYFTRIVYYLLSSNVSKISFFILIRLLIGGIGSIVDDDGNELALDEDDDILKN